ncbi:hypothetical protein [Bacillus sp. CECT 9360]|uniref:hypothetical protein n=1 Tax=Bacillus sp. CECT 9360 TaxID=2845821 RepID=UPI001E309794|nr:hypothetical protein [Bacillus sp. CECT 9360]CAH0346163.1 hypothetical protein BCI9360_02483 [Bacillus sp. CECT 9360]
MNAFIIFILFLLNILTIFAVIILFLRQNRLMAAERNQKETMAEIEELMSAFVMEMKEENELLLEKLHRPDLKEKQAANNETATHATFRPSATTEQLPSSTPPATEKLNPQALGKVSKNAAVLAYKNQKPLAETEKSTGYEPAGLTERPDMIDITAHGDSPGQSELMEETRKSNFKETLNKSVNNSSQSLPQDIFEMYDQGLTTEEIAKKLNRGKTEIELLLKFRI